MSVRSLNFIKTNSMHGFVELDHKFKLPESFDISVFDQLPIYNHSYGNKMENDPTTLYWTEYRLPKPYGSISFLRRLCVGHIDITKYVTDYLTDLFYQVPFDYRRVCLLKTQGTIPPHVDESNRKCCINIGIKNSSIATTRTSSTTNRTIFESQAKSSICQDGHAYLLDTSSIHEVVSEDNSTCRYLFTYGFGSNFNTILSCYKGNI